MSPTCKSWNLIVMRGLKQTSFANIIFLSIAKAKTCWRIIITCCPKNWMQKNKDKWPLNHLLWKRHAHSLMKQYILCLGVLCTSMTVADSNSHKKLGNNTESFGTITNNTTTHTQTKNNIWSFRTRINNIQRKKTGSNINIGRAYTTGVDESEEQSLKVLYLYY
jgi:hypothetical protein